MSWKRCRNADRGEERVDFICSSTTHTMNRARRRRPWSRQGRVIGSSGMEVCTEAQEVPCSLATMDGKQSASRSDRSRMTRISVVRLQFLSGRGNLEVAMQMHQTLVDEFRVWRLHEGGKLGSRASASGAPSRARACFHI
jgi:hypothetical protein